MTEITEIHISQILPGSANQLIGANAGGTVNEYKTVSGTSNQITVTNGVGTMTLSLPTNVIISGLSEAGAFTATNGGVTVLGSLSSVPGYINLYDISQSHDVTISAPTSLTSYQLTLPIAQGSSGQTLSNDGSGNLSWISQSQPFREDYIVGTASGNYTGSTTVFNLINSYVVGSHTLIVTVDGVVMTLGSTADYLETNSTTVTFNNALVTGERVSFIFSQPAGATSGIVNSGTTGQIAYYATGGTTVSGENTVPISAGGTNSTTALSNGFLMSSSGGSIVESTEPIQGSITISTNTNWTGNRFIPTGTTITVNSGQTLTITGNIIAGAYPIFTGTGTVVIKGQTNVVYAEWFGALCNGSNDDSLAIQAAVNALTLGGIVQLLARQYTCKTTITINNPSVTLQGSAIGPSPYDGPTSVGGTQLLGVNGTDCITLSSNIYITVRDLEISLASGATTACTAINVTSCFLPKILNIRTTNYSTGIHLYGGNTDIYVERCYLSSVGSTVLTVVGLNIDGGSHLQNQSVYISDCISAAGTFSGVFYPYWLHGNRINDVHFTNCEADGGTYGFYIDGSVGLDAGYSGDILLESCVADGNVTYGFYVNTCNADSIININNGWSAGGSIGVYVATSFGVNVTGIQCYGNTHGIYVGASSKDCSIIGNTIRYAASNGIAIDGSPTCTVADNIIITNSSTTTNAIQLLSGATYCSIIGNIADGPSSGFSRGILVNTGCDFGTVVGNSMPTTIITTPYVLNLSSNTNLIAIEPGIPLQIANGGTGATSLASIPSSLGFATTTNGIIGTATNDSASAGIVGEYISSTVTSGAPVTLTTSGTTYNITSITLTAGDWDVIGIVGYIPGGTLTVGFQGCGTTSATLNDELSNTYFPISTTVAARFPIGSRRFSLSTTTIIYLVAQATFTVSCTAFGTIAARRSR